MTDVSLAVADFVSEAETPPIAAPAPGPSLTCRFCSATFDGAARGWARGRHEKAQHEAEWLKAKAGGPVKKKAAKKPAAPKAPRVTGPVTKPKRIAAGESIGTALGMLAKLVQNVDAPVGRALQFSAPATGEAVDELVAGTVVDRLVVQKFAGAANKWEKVGGVIAFPVLIAVVSRNPALFGPLEDQLRSATVDVITASVPTLKKRKQRETAAAQALADLGKVDPRFAETDDPIRLILEDIFGVSITSEPNAE